MRERGRMKGREGGLGRREGGRREEREGWRIGKEGGREEGEDEREGRWIGKEREGGLHCQGLVSTWAICFKQCIHKSK